eukprot:13042801-Heterocapsa_arctica.AAC.1
MASETALRSRRPSAAITIVELSPATGTDAGAATYTPAAGRLGLSPSRGTTTTPARLDSWPPSGSCGSAGLARSPAYRLHSLAWSVPQT